MATPTARLPFPVLLPISMCFILFLNISLLLLWLLVFAFPSTFRSFDTLVFSDTWCLCKLASFTFPLSFLPVTPILVTASGLCLLLLVGLVSRASETFLAWWSVLPEGSGWLVGFTDSLAVTAWSFPVLESNCDLAAAPLPGLVDLCCTLAGLVLDDEAWDRSTKAEFISAN